MARILIIDEATLLDRRNFEKMERTLRDICNQDLPWGGKTIVFSGDFRLGVDKVQIEGSLRVKKCFLKEFFGSYGPFGTL